jgi:hypothetical protein
MNEKTKMKLIEIFILVDEFFKEKGQEIEQKLLSENGGNNPKVPCGLAMSEIMTIEIFYHLHGFKCFKYYYTQFVMVHLKEYFPGIFSYSRFLQKKPSMLLYLFCFMLTCRLGSYTNCYFIDSTKLTVCHNLRINSNKVFKNIAKRGKTSTGWFYGLKLHLIINEMGEIVSFFITKGNVADNDFELGLMLCKGLCGKIFGDKGYINEKLQQELIKRNLLLVTKIKKNMKNKFVNIEDKIILKKRGVIESVIDILKHICDIEHSRHRSVINAFVNILSGLTAYSFLDHKPTIKKTGVTNREYIVMNSLTDSNRKLLVA